jgi:hypothetical protein
VYYELRSSASLVFVCSDSSLWKYTILRILRYIVSCYVTVCCIVQYWIEVEGSEVEWRRLYCIALHCIVI